MQIESFGIIGYGHFGQFIELLAKRFLPGLEVRIHSRRTQPDGRQFFTLEEAASADVVILCGSIAEFEEQLLSVLPHMSETGILVDVATVKRYPSGIFKQYAADRHWLSCHPMFGPESYKKTNGNLAGFRIVVTDYTLVNDEYIRARHFFEQIGCVVVEMTADEHDRLLAETLFITHYVGQVVHQAGFGHTPIDTVSFRFLMDAVESVYRDEALFHDVYRFNPYCQAAAKQFALAQTKVLDSLPQPVIEDERSQRVQRKLDTK